MNSSRLLAVSSLANRAIGLRSMGVVLFVFSMLVAPSNALAQNDQVFIKGSNKAQRGDVAQITKDGVQLKVGANAKAILSSDIHKILFQGDPSELTKGREFALDGQYEQALEELEKIDFAKIKRAGTKSDVMYFTLLSRAKLALAGRGDKTKALNQAKQFVTANSNSWHFYSSAKLLGDLALANSDFTNAGRYYSQLGKSKSVETRIESVYLAGITKLRSGETAKALADLDKIVKFKADTPAKLRLQTLAKAGKAVGLARSGKANEGLGLVKEMIAVLNPTDVEMSARIYNAQGASYEAAGDVEGAVMAYLHTHLMFSTQPDAHAEALVRLIDLFPKIGKPERAAEMRQELQQRYPSLAQ